MLYRLFVGTYLCIHTCSFCVRIVYIHAYYILLHYCICIKGSLVEKLPMYERHRREKNGRVANRRAENRRVENRRVENRRVDNRRVDNRRVDNRRDKNSREKNRREKEQHSQA